LVGHPLGEFGKSRFDSGAIMKVTRKLRIKRSQNVLIKRLLRMQSVFTKRLRQLEKKAGAKG
jgi:hypothetical protein